MYAFGKRNLFLAGIALLLLALLAIAARSSMQSAGADTGKAIQTRNAKIDEAMRMAEGR